MTYVCDDPDHPFSTGSIEKWNKHLETHKAWHTVSGPCRKCGKRVTDKINSVLLPNEAPMCMCPECKAEFVAEAAAAAGDGA